MPDESDVLVYVGDAVKALDDTGRVGGYLVRYGSPDDVDLTGDYFDASTDFDVDEWPHKSRVYYQHGLDQRLKHRKLGNGEMRQDEIGVWVEAQLGLRDEYEKAIFELVKQGKMGWSSGTAGHLVEREEKGAGSHILHWPLGLDASITPTPAEYRNSAVSLKSLSATDSSFTVFLSEADRSSAVQETKADQDAQESTSNSGEIEMEDQDNEAIETMATVDVPALVESAVTKAFAPVQAWLDKQPVKAADIALPAQLKLGRGDSEMKAYSHFLRTGDESGIRHMKASNATDMNVGTPADGGYAVPTGHYQQIIARMSESALYGPLGVLNIPGKGTTVNVPLDAEADGEFIATNEAAATDLDAPAVGQAPMTLVKYTKRLEISWELLNDEDSQLMPFIENFVGRGMAKTHNQLLVTEATTNGTLGSAIGNPIVAANVPALLYSLKTGYEDGAAWVMRKATEGVIRGLTGTNFQFVPTSPDPSLSRRELWGFPLYNTDKMPAAAASAKSVLFGNFRYMGMRLAPDITFIRDPYSKAGTGQLVLHYYFRTVYKVLQAEAILFGTQGT